MLYSDSPQSAVPTWYRSFPSVRERALMRYIDYDKHTFKVTWTSIHVKQPQYYGTYWAKKPSGYHYKMVYYYK